MENQDAFWICQCENPFLFHILETVTLDADALSALETSAQRCQDWLAREQKFDPAEPLWITPVDGLCLPSRWVEYARMALPGYTEADETWLANDRVPGEERCP